MSVKPAALEALSDEELTAFEVFMGGASYRWPAFEKGATGRLIAEVRALRTLAESRAREVAEAEERTAKGLLWTVLDHGWRGIAHIDTIEFGRGRAFAQCDCSPRTGWQGAIPSGSTNKQRDGFELWAAHVLEAFKAAKPGTGTP
jgi:hypothetical protein